MFCVALPYKVLALRNPFSCAHVHGIPVGPSQQVATAKTKKSAISQALADDTADDSASEWHVIADKDGIVIMQHTDGSIREITIGT
jgi:hypothetical protein